MFRMRRPRAKGHHLYEIVEEKIGGVFTKYGRFVSRHAWKMIIVTIIVNCSLGVGLVRLKWDKSVKNVFLPKDSQGEKDEEKTVKLFPDLSGRNFNPLRQSQEGFWGTVIVKSRTGNLLTRSILEEIRNFSSLIENITVTDDTGATVSFSEICAISHSKCYIDGDIFWDATILNAIDNEQLTYPVFVHPVYGPVYYTLYTGGKKTFDDLGQYLRSFEYLKLGYYVRTDTERFRTLAPKWADAFRETLASYYNSHFDIAFGHFNSLDEELHKNIIGDIFLFAGTIALMMLYACIATMSSRCSDQVGQRMLLGTTGILAAGLAILSSFGLCSAVGIDFVNIIGALPFLVIGIGIDDMFLLLSGLSESQSKESTEDKIAETLRISGVGITITTLTDLIAFMAGVGSSFKAVRNFCIYTGVAVVFCYLNNVTFFAACMVLNERRVAERRHFLTFRPIKTKKELREEGKSGSYVICCGGQPPTSREEAESIIDKFPRWLIPKIVLKLPFKIIIIVIFIGYMAGAIYGCINLRQGLHLTQLANFDSYFYKYSDWSETYFTRQTIVSFVIQDTEDYTALDTQSKLTNLVSSAQSHKYFDDNFEVNWLKSYSISPYFDSSSKSAFVAGLRNFTNDPVTAAYENDIVIAGDEITVSRVYVLTTALADSQQEGKMMLASRNIAATAEINCYATSTFFIYFEQFVRVLGQTLQSVGIALAAVFVVTCVFMPHPVLVVFVTVVVVMIMAGVFGFMLYIDVELSAITMIQLIMCIGFSVDFTAHICHGYIISPGETRAEKVQHAIDETGAPIFHGAVSSIIGIVVLNAAKSYIFRTFAAVLSFVLFFGITHALLLLPVVLSWVGPMHRSTVGHDDTNTSDKHENRLKTTDAAVQPKASNGHIPDGNEYKKDVFKLSNNSAHAVIMNGTYKTDRIHERKNITEEFLEKRDTSHSVKRRGSSLPTLTNKNLESLHIDNTESNALFHGRSEKTSEGEKYVNVPKSHDVPNKTGAHTNQHVSQSNKPASPHRGPNMLARKPENQRPKGLKTFKESRLVNTVDVYHQPAPFI